MAKLKLYFTKIQAVNEASFPAKAAESWFCSHYTDLNLEVLFRDEYILNDKNESIVKVITLIVTGSLERCQQFIDDINSSETMVNKVITDNAAFCDLRIKLIE
jgi:hypothetical protein